MDIWQEIRKDSDRGEKTRRDADEKFMVSFHGRHQ